ncbi:MAG: cell division protein DivIVA [Deltaproteobacteria bacterium HGW-Deltaproteobacteria-23]|nr:MAG: cell division protein DivIVA [Deltaproteobacteria bacterium HGW-Deltaproteobacteria-23]
MNITPLDIQQQQFKGKMLGGLDPRDVDTFLQMVAAEMEDLIRENTELKEQVRKASLQLDEFSQREVTLRDTILAAQKVTEEMKANAQKEAHLIVSEAELKGERIVADAENRLLQLNNQIHEIRRQKLQFESNLKSTLDSHLKMLTLEE